MSTPQPRPRHTSTYLLLTNVLLLLATATLAFYLTLTNTRLATKLTALEARLTPPNRALSVLLTTELTPALTILINETRSTPDPTNPTLTAQPLEADIQLTWMAQLRADDMAAQDYYAHSNPRTNASASSILAGFGGFNTFVGENIWICADWQQCTPTLIHETFMASQGHAQNVRNPQYTHLGLGFSAIRELLYIVELYSNQSLGFRAPK